MTCNNYSTPSHKDRASTSTYPHEVNKLPLVVTFVFAPEYSGDEFESRIVISNAATSPTSRVSTVELTTSPLTGEPCSGSTIRWQPPLAPAAF